MRPTVLRQSAVAAPAAPCLAGAPAASAPAAVSWATGAQGARPAASSWADRAQAPARPQGAPSPGAPVRTVSMADIDVDAAWNSRHAGHALFSSGSETDEESTGLEGLIANLLAHGLDTPLEVRSTAPPFYKMTDKPLSLVAGFRRYAALAWIFSNAELRQAAEKEGRFVVPGLLNETVRVRDHEAMSERDAFLLNARENTARDNLSPPEVLTLVQRGGAFGMHVGDLAVHLNKSPVWIARYVEIGRLPVEILTHWQNGGTFEGLPSSKRLALADMVEVSKADCPQDAYKAALLRVARRIDASAVTLRAAARARRVGAVVAALEHAGLLIVRSTHWNAVIDRVAGVQEKTMKWKEGHLYAQAAEGGYRKERDRLEGVGSADKGELPDDGGLS